MKTKVLFILVFSTLMLTVTPLVAHGNVMSILNVYSNLPDTVGYTITVEGYFYSSRYLLLGLNKEMFKIRSKSSPHSYLRLKGSLPVVTPLAT